MTRKFRRWFWVSPAENTRKSELLFDVFVLPKLTCINPFTDDIDDDDLQQSSKVSPQRTVMTRQYAGCPMDQHTATVGYLLQCCRELGGVVVAFDFLA